MSASDQDHEPPLDEAAHIVGDSFKWIRRFVALWLIVVFLMVSGVLGTVLYKVDQIDRTVTSHNTELARTLDAACILIRSDPHLPVTDCPPQHKP